MHFVDEAVGGVGECREVGVGYVPGPGSGPGIAFGEDVLGCGTRPPDCGYGGLVEVEYECLVHVVVFVVNVEDLDGNEGNLRQQASRGG